MDIDRKSNQESMVNRSNPRSNDTSSSQRSRKQTYDEYLQMHRDKPKRSETASLRRTRDFHRDHPFSSGMACLPVSRSASDSQDVRNMRTGFPSERHTKSSPGWPAPLSLNRDSRSSMTPRSANGDSPTARIHMGRSFMQSPTPRSVSRETRSISPSLISQSPIGSPKYETPLDKSVIWRLAESGPHDGLFTYMNDQLMQHGLSTVPDHKGKRILIKGKTCSRDSGYTQFVGTILHVDDVTGVSLLSTMPTTITVDARTLSSVRKYWNDLELLQAEDGTTLGLYWYQDQWVIRTAGSFDARSIRWDGNITFGQMMDDIMKKYPQFRYELLDKKKCYTFGIKHPAIHIYREGRGSKVTRAWFISSTNISLINSQFGIFNGSIQFDESIGLPHQRPLNLATFDAMRTVSFSPHQQFARETCESESTGDKNTHSGVTLDMILDHTRGALGAAISSTDDTDLCYPALSYYGVILRNKKYTFFVPSDLYQYITSTCYTNELNDMLGDERFNRDKFIILFNALCPLRERDIFSHIYPQYAILMGKIREYLNNEFVAVMYAIYNKMITGKEIDTFYAESTVDLARSLFINWARIYGTPKSGTRSELMKLFSDYILDKSNARVLYHDVYAHIAYDE